MLLGEEEKKQTTKNPKQNPNKKQPPKKKPHKKTPPDLKADSTSSLLFNSSSDQPRHSSHIHVLPASLSHLCLASQMPCFAMGELPTEATYTPGPQKGCQRSAKWLFSWARLQRMDITLTRFFNHPHLLLLEPVLTPSMSPVHQGNGTEWCFQCRRDTGRVKSSLVRPILDVDKSWSAARPSKPGAVLSQATSMPGHCCYQADQCVPHCHSAPQRLPKPGCAQAACREEGSREPLTLGRGTFRPRIFNHPCTLLTAAKPGTALPFYSASPNPWPEEPAALQPHPSSYLQPCGKDQWHAVTNQPQPSPLKLQQPAESCTPSQKCATRAMSREEDYFLQNCEKNCSYGGVFLSALCCYFESGSWLGFLFLYLFWIAFFLPFSLEE